MKRPNRDTHKETLTQTDYIWYSKSLEKYINFLESNQKEFEEWLEHNIECFKGVNESILIDVLTKYKELNK